MLVHLPARVSNVTPRSLGHELRLLRHQNESAPFPDLLERLVEYLFCQTDAHTCGFVKPVIPGFGVVYPYVVWMWVRVLSSVYVGGCGGGGGGGGGWGGYIEMNAINSTRLLPLPPPPLTPPPTPPPTPHRAHGGPWPHYPPFLVRGTSPPPSCQR